MFISALSHNPICVTLCHNYLHRLKSIANFRAKRRIPVICYLHQPVIAPSTPSATSPLSDFNATRTSALMRCSQPVVGLMGARNSDDEKFMRHVVSACHSNSLVIIDARPYANASLNNFNSGGFETVENYKSGCIKECTISFLNIENIHAVRKCYDTVIPLCLQLMEEHNQFTEYHTILNIASTPYQIAHDHKSASSAASVITTTLQHNSPPNDSVHAHFWTKLCASNYFVYIEHILNGTKMIVNALNSGTCVLTHCSDGW